MELLLRKFKTPPFLLELFGRETTILDLFFIVFGSLALTVFVWALSLDSVLPVYKLIVLALLCLDIGGGVVANFSTGTNNFYQESISRRYLFLLVHVIQPAVLIWLFPTDSTAIATLSAFTLLSSFIITSRKHSGIQRTLAASMMLTYLLLNQSFHFTNPMVELILMTYSLKLMVAFSVNWINFES